MSYGCPSIRKQASVDNLHTTADDWLDAFFPFHAVFQRQTTLYQHLATPVQITQKYRL